MSTTTTTIQLGDGGGAYVFDVPPEFAPRITTLRDSHGERTGERHTWPVRGYLRGAGPDNINTLWNSLKTKLQTEKVNVYFKRGEVVLQQLLASQAERGPQFDGPSIESADETCWDSNLCFSFDITADIYSTQDGVIETEYSVTYRQNEDGSYTRTKSGSVTTKLGTSAHAAALMQAPSVPSNYKMVSSSVTPNDDDTQADFSFAMQSLFSELPDQVLVAERVVDESVENGLKTTTYRATFTGPGASRAAEDYKPEGSVLRRSISTSEDRDSVTVTYTVQDSLTGAQRLSYYNSLSIEKSLPSLQTKIMDGGNPTIFIGGNTPAVIRENGRTVYKDEVPPEVAPLAAGGLYLRSSLTTVRPESASDEGDAVHFVRRWSYVYFAKSNADVAAVINLLHQRLNTIPE